MKFKKPNTIEKQTHNTRVSPWKLLQLCTVCVIRRLSNETSSLNLHRRFPDSGNNHHQILFIHPSYEDQIPIA
ncbi:hypothetical protein AALP_AA4G097300 [Arabis alpina]|uniref:Uncharacterized protein n=1 Tax=Arabis alpina TaxID=50452 RepID=A0A087H295_ARAAL|nr:hypothetical protein AALP_AA4G097300 [Arabis alpina]